MKRHHKILLIFFLLLSILLLSFLSITILNHIKNNEALVSKLLNKNSYQSKISTYHADNIRLFPSNFDLFKFSFKKDQFNPTIDAYQKIDICQVRGFPLRSPLFEGKILSKDLNDYTFYWSYEEDKRGTKDVARQTLIAVNFTKQIGWFLRTGWLEKGANWGASPDFLLDWQSDSFYVSRGCLDMGV